MKRSLQFNPFFRIGYCYIDINYSLNPLKDGHSFVHDLLNTTSIEEICIQDLKHSELLRNIGINFTFVLLAY